MNMLKRKRMMENYSGFAGSQTIIAVLKQVPESLLDALTGKEIGLVMNAITAAYHAGKAAAGAELIDDNAIYINKIARIVEWKEEGAEYQDCTEKSADGVTRHYSKKIKSGELVCRFMAERE